MGREMKRSATLTPVLREDGQGEGWSYCAERVPTTSSLPLTPALPGYGGEGNMRHVREVLSRDGLPCRRIRLVQVLAIISGFIPDQELEQPLAIFIGRKRWTACG